MKIRCEVCGIEGQLQHLSRNFYRIKHYLGSVDGKVRFGYHKQSLEYVKSNLGHNNVGNIDLIGQKSIDPNNLNSSSDLVRGVGFEPTNLYRIAASGLRL